MTFHKHAKTSNNDNQITIFFLPKYDDTSHELKYFVLLAKLNPPRQVIHTGGKTFASSKEDVVSLPFLELIQRNILHIVLNHVVFVLFMQLVS